jgi:hypothetical protein
VLNLYDSKSGNKKQLGTMLLKIVHRRVTLEQQRDDIDQMLVELEMLGWVAAHHFMLCKNMLMKNK